MPETVWCRGCESFHPATAEALTLPVIECANAPDDGSLRLIDTRRLKSGGERVFTNYDGLVWVCAPQ